MGDALSFSIMITQLVEEGCNIAEKHPKKDVKRSSFGGSAKDFESRSMDGDIVESEKKLRGWYRAKKKV